MRRLGFFLLVAVVGAGLAFAAGPTIHAVRQFFKGGISIGNDTAGNRIADTVTADVDYDFPNTTIVCNDSWSGTATGAAIGDTCFVGIGPRDGGSQIVAANSTFNAYVSAADTVVVRHCPAGTAINPADAGYVVRCFGSQ